jgi:hypothetical protein
MKTHIKIVLLYFITITIISCKKGNNGDTGPVGPKGINGDIGIAGANGANGKDGTSIPVLFSEWKSFEFTDPGFNIYDNSSISSELDRFAYAQFSQEEILLSTANKENEYSIYLKSADSTGAITGITGINTIYELKKQNGSFANFIISVFSNGQKAITIGLALERKRTSDINIFNSFLLSNGE